MKQRLSKVVGTEGYLWK